MSDSKQLPNLDSFSTFLKNVAPKKGPSEDVPVDLNSAPIEVLEAVNKYSGPVKIQELQKDHFKGMSVTRLALSLGKLKDMQLVDIDDDQDLVSLTETGKTTCRILPKLGQHQS